MRARFIYLLISAALLASFFAGWKWCGTPV
jgi:hypothetical protein